MTPNYGELVALGALAVVIVFPLAGVYQSWRSGSVLLVAARVLAAWFAVFVLLMVFLVATKQAESFSRLWLISWFASAAVLLMALRIAAYAALQRLRRRGFNIRRVAIVGPRPERPVFVEQFKSEIPGYMQKHMIKAGITGLAQINGWRGRTDLSKRIEHDRYYIEHWSLWLDLKIIFLTLFTGFVNRNAY